MVHGAGRRNGERAALRDGASGIFRKRYSMSEETSVSKGVASWPAQVKDYFGELHLEMKHVTWPRWTQVRATTGVVIAAVFGFAIYFFIVDAIIGRGVTKLFGGRLAGAEGFEPPLAVLETAGLPLNLRP